MECAACLYIILGKLLPRMGNGIMDSPGHGGAHPSPFPSDSVPIVSPFKYVIVLALSIRKDSPYLNKKS